MEIEEILQKYKTPIIFFLFGLFFLGMGVLTFKIFFTNEQEIEISSISEESPQNGKIIVDIAGAVLKPGVYELKNGSRINDLLILAEGLSPDADRDYVAQNINLAQKLVDGAKIYIPKKSEIQNLKFETGKNDKVLGIGGKININTASQKELETLWGIGPATAQKIIDNRPYQKIEDLLTKKIVKSNTWETIKDKITVW